MTAEFVVGAHRLVDGEWWLYVQTYTGVGRELGLWELGDRLWGPRSVAVRDLPIADHPVALAWSL